MITLTELNNLSNHPAVAAQMAPGYYNVDLSKFYAQTDKLIVGDELGVIIMANMGRGVYCWHWMLTPVVRGAAALVLGRKALNEAFTRPEINAICGSTPRDNRAARLMNRLLGARPIGTSIDACARECVNYILERDTWVQLLQASLAQPAV